MGKVVQQWQLRCLLDGYETIVATNGCFDILHVGHKRLLEQARKLGDVLVVAVNDDKSVRKLKRAPRPMIPEDERAEMLAAFSFVDYVVVFAGSTAESIMATIEPDIFVKGDDTDPDKIPEQAVVERLGGELRLLPVTPHHSSTAVISELGPADAEKHVRFKLFDNLENAFVSFEEVARQNIVLSAEGKLLQYRAGVVQQDGHRFPTGKLHVADVSARYGLVSAVATG